MTKPANYGNHLGLICPRCKGGGELKVEAVVVVRLTESGVEQVSDTMWEEDGHVICDGCGWEGKAGEMEEEE
jgi:hypothetical protein